MAQLAQAMQPTGDTDPLARIPADLGGPDTLHGDTSSNEISPLAMRTRGRRGATAFRRYPKWTAASRLLTGANRRNLLSQTCGRSFSRSGGSSQGLKAAIAALAALWAPDTPATLLHHHFK